MCLNGKCVPEHENAVDFSGDGFFRRSGSSSGVDDDIIENYTEPKDRPRFVAAIGTTFIVQNSCRNQCTAIFSTWQHCEPLKYFMQSV